MNNDKCIISITPNISKADESVNIKLSGFPINEKIIIRAVTNDYYCINASIREIGDNTTWESYATFITDDHGNIDLENQEPIDGTYSACDKMGLFYSMKVKEKHRGNLTQSLSEISENRKYTITFIAEKDGEILVSHKHTRVYCDDSIKSVDVVENNLLARYFTSNNKMARPTVIVVSGSDGRIEKAQAIAETLAMKGYSTLAICYFGMKGTPKELSCIPLEYIENAIEWLKKNDTVNKDKISIYGRSKGSEMVLLAASVFQDITCVIANTPSCYVYEGIKKGVLHARHSSWIYRGTEIPYLKFSWSSMLQFATKMLLNEEGALAWLYNKVTVDSDTAEAVITVDKINGPILMLSSNADAIWPSKIYSETIMEMLEKANFKYEYKHCTYEKSGHLLTLPYQAIPSLRGFGGETVSCAKASVNSWNETINFLKKWAT